MSFRGLKPRILLVRAAQTALFAVATSLVITNGYHLQQYFFALMTSDEAGLSEGVYQGIVVDFYSVSEWVWAASDWVNLLMGTCIAIVTLRARHPKRVFIYSAIATFVVLMTVDVVQMYIVKQMSPDFVMKNFIANLIGSPVVASIIVLFVLSSDLVYAQTRGNIAKYVSLFIPTAVGVLVSIAFYYCVLYLYVPTTVKLIAYLEADTRGHFFTKRPTEVPDRQHANSWLSVIPPDVADAKVELRSSETQLRIEWYKLMHDANYEVSVAFFSGCDSFQRDSIPEPKHPYRISDLASFAVQADAGPSGLQYGGEGRSSFVEIIGERGAFFGLSKGAKEDTSDLSQFLSEYSSISVWDNGHTSEFRLDIPSMGFVNGAVVPLDRAISLTLNNRLLKVVATTPRTDLPNSECIEVPAAHAFERDEFALPQATDTLTLLVRFTDNEKVGVRHGERASFFSVSGAEGWIVVKDLRHDLFAGDLRRGYGLGFSGNVRSLSVNGTEMSTNELFSYNGVGEFDGSFDSQGRLRFSGDARAFWAEGTRVNPTRWERLSSEFKVAAIAVAISAMAGLMSLLALHIQKNRRSPWLSIT